ncbi:MAG: beta-ketoacyl-ACP synthase III [Alphaproteobacteria bacterium]|nr:beta-ketoacyl-ACP synthase III [Alphaproteobacteria bacterium]
MTLRAIVTGSGGYLPERILTNEELSRTVDTSDEWIRARTGIGERRIAAADEVTSDLAVNAARDAMAEAGVGPGDVDLVIVATTTPDRTFPATAAIVQAKLGVENGAAFDVQAVCCGFVFALATAANFLAAGSHKRALVIGAETFSRIVDWTDRATCVLFGDGAGAMVLEAQDIDVDPDAPAAARGLIATEIRTDGRLADLLYVDGGVSSTGTAGQVRMQGNRLFRQAVDRIANAMVTVAERARIAPADVDWFVPHQANERILNGVVDRLALRRDCVVSTIAGHGNTSAASIPLAYTTARRDGRIKTGDLIMIEGLGGGLTWGAGLFRA